MPEAKSNVIDLVDHEELLLMFGDYVSGCIKESSPSKPIHPVSFDRWYSTDYLPSIDQHTQVIGVTHQWEDPSDDLLDGPSSERLHVRVPKDALRTLAIRRLGRKLALMLGQSMPVILHEGQRIYHWTWD